MKFLTNQQQQDSRPIKLSHVAAIFLIFLSLVLKIADGNAAVVTSVSQNTGMGFSLVTQGASGGTIKTAVSCAGTGTAKKIGTTAAFPCANGVFLISGSNNSTGANRNRVTIIIPASATISSGGITMNVALSLSSVAVVKQRSIVLSGPSGGIGTFSFPVYGTLTLGANQNSGDYNGSYNVMVCNNSLTSC